jgi:hypothetical protein
MDPTASTDPAALVRQLDPDSIRERIDAIDRERKALLVLLRAARRAQADRLAPRKEDRHAD